MTTAIGIMDREGWDHRTDIIVLINSAREELLWIPRDLYCECLSNRINTAYKRGGHPLFQSAFLEHDIKVDESICLLRSVVERAFNSYQITVPVEEAQEFYYPLAPQQPIEDGKKLIRFTPPEEHLEGERFHQWIGARVPLEGYTDATGDLVRIKRQQILLKRLLEEGFDFSEHTKLGLDLNGISVSSQAALEEAAKVRANWTFRTLTGIKAVTLRKMYVFVRENHELALANS